MPAMLSMVRIESIAPTGRSYKNQGFPHERFD